MNGLRKAYLPVNQAWLVLWFDSRLAGPFNTEEEADEYIQRIQGANTPVVAAGYLNDTTKHWPKENDDGAARS